MKGIIYQIEREDLKEEIRELAEEAALAKFEDRMVGVNTVADIHGVSRDTVIRRIEDGMIIPETDKGEHYKFKLSEVLKMDFRKMKKQLRFGKTKVS